MQREDIHNCWSRIWSQTTRESPCNEQEHLQTMLSKCVLLQTLCTGTQQDWIQTITCKPGPVDERLQDTLQVRYNLGGQYSCHVQGAAQSDLRIQGGRGVQTPRSRRTQILPWGQPTTTLQGRHLCTIAIRKSPCVPEWIKGFWAQLFVKIRIISLVPKFFWFTG